ncbi:aldolase/citrate lyase family protein [Thetidibacter halocola]|uniref:HpcH/HpaI aldolase/citrate lyase domain-containing protein n=1 Tax=Thetidibacter halocola TaxID=2827239 RepID=A0A8J8B644_9RHOB|nr:aldolase/citrate lyase family protein [Thetidibacter halocola]MBS0122942.1 hypothetical protein [Thetidibacter halocola]
MSAFRQRLHGTQGRMTVHVVTIHSPSVTQVHAMIAATQGFDCAPTVRVDRIDAATVKRVPAPGAEGVVFPQVRNAGDARAAVASMRYPPLGVRGFDPFLAHSRWGQAMPENASEIEDRLIFCLLVETRDAVETIDAMFDLPPDTGLMGQFGHPDLLAAMAQVERAAQAAGNPLGNVGPTGAQAQGLFARSYRVIAGFDALWPKAMAAEAQAWCRRG